MGDDGRSWPQASLANSGGTTLMMSLSATVGTDGRLEGSCMSRLSDKSECEQLETKNNSGLGFVSR